MMKKEMMKEMAEMSKMPEMSDMPEMMKKEMMKEMMKEMSKKMNEYGSMNAMKEETMVVTKVDKDTNSPAYQKFKAGDKRYTYKEDAEDLEEKHVPGHNDSTEMSVGEIYAQAITQMNAMRKTRTTEMMNTTKTDEFDMAPDAKKLNAMIKDPHKSREENPKKDLNATYMKSDVRADVKNGGGADMSKVQDAPKMMTAMKKISAMYKTEKYHESKPGSLNDVLAQMHLNEQKSVSVKVQEFSSLVETYLARGGVVGNISEAVKQVELNKSLRLNELREFITTYNLHFLTNYRAEEFIKEDNLSEKMMGKYRIENDPMAGEFGFVSKKAFDDNQKKVGGNKGVMTMVKRGMNPDMIAKKYGMYPDAVRKMAKGQTL
jgi:hypothetical protein